MSLEYSIEEHSEILHILLKGRYNASDFDQLASVLRSEALGRGIAKVLCDSMQMTGSVPAADEFQLGVEIAEMWKGGLKVAMVPSPGVITNLLENTAVNRGGNVLVTSDKERALGWLLQE